jgi:hypothetical protein
MVKAPFLDKRLVERDPMLGYLVAKAGHEWRPELEPILVFEEENYSISITNLVYPIDTCYFCSLYVLYEKGFRDS